MTTKTPRGKTPSLIGSTHGRPKLIPVQRRCECRRCGHHIEAGDACFGIPKLGTGFSNHKRFCATCYKNILEQTRRDLAELEQLLTVPATAGADTTG